MPAVIDLITLEVVQEYFISTVREMRMALIRTAHSSIIYEAHDFSCALLNAEGDLVAQSEDSPAHIIPLPWQVREALAFFAGDVNPGDVILVNDPYTSGTHMNDVAMIVPVFAGRRRIAFAVVRAHWTDVGGMTPGSVSGRATEIFQEGLRIPFVKVYQGGTPVLGVLDLIFANVRIPDEREGDFHAMLACCHTARARFGELVGRFGVDQVEATMEGLLERAERRMREAISRIPAGTYPYEDYFDSDNVSANPVLLRVELTAADSRLDVDFAGSAPQVKGPINCSLAVTTMGTFVALKALLDPETPINHGAFRPITVAAPEGSIVNVGYPGAAGGYNDVRRRVAAVVMGALSGAVPKYAAGDIKGTGNQTCIGSVHPARRRSTIFYESPSGGTGGFLEGDGGHVVRAYDEGDFGTIFPAEAVELEHALLVERCELRVDSCGDGRRRGGLGMRREVRLLAPEGNFSELSDRNVIPPYGVCGGGSGAPNRFTVRRDGAVIEPSELPGKVSGFPLEKDDIVVMETSGGGGYGRPTERDPASVARDVREGYITRARARERYGVVFRGDSVDQAATKKRRRRLRDGVMILRIVAVDGDDFSENRRICRLAPATARALKAGDGALIEFMNPRGAPLRAWIAASGDVAEGYVRLGPVARTILGLADGDRVELCVLGRVKNDGRGASG